MNSRKMLAYFSVNFLDQIHAPPSLDDLFSLRLVQRANDTERQPQLTLKPIKRVNLTQFIVDSFSGARLLLKLFHFAIHSGQ